MDARVKPGHDGSGTACWHGDPPLCLSTPGSGECPISSGRSL